MTRIRITAELHLEELGDLAKVRKVIRREIEARAGA